MGAAVAVPSDQTAPSVATHASLSILRRTLHLPWSRYECKSKTNPAQISAHIGNFSLLGANQSTAAQRKRRTAV